VRDLLVVHRQNRDLISVGAYVAGTNPALDHALKVMPRLESFLRQSHRDVVDDTSLWTSLAEAIRIPQPMPSASPSSRSASVGSLRAAGGR